MAGASRTGATGTDGPDPGPAPAAGTRLSYVVGRLDRAVSRELTERLRPFGISLSQFTTLSVLRGRPGLSNAQLARRAMITPQSMMTVTSTLETRGLVTRTASPANGRVLEAVLTEEGERLLRRCEHEVDELEDLMTAGLTPEQSAQLLHLAQSCVQQLGGGH